MQTSRYRDDNRCQSCWLESNHPRSLCNWPVVTQMVKPIHFNARELMAVLLTIYAFLTYLKFKNIRILTDNISTVTLLNHLGRSSNMLNQIATSVWATALQHKIQISARHLPGTLNLEVDAPSCYENP